MENVSLSPYIPSGELQEIIIDPNQATNGNHMLHRTYINNMTTVNLKHSLSIISESAEPIKRKRNRKIYFLDVTHNDPLYQINNVTRCIPNHLASNLLTALIVKNGTNYYISPTEQIVKAHLKE